MCALLHERYLRAELPCARSLQMLLTHLCATVGLIRSPASEDRLDGLYELAATIDGTFGRGEGAALGEAVRRLDGVELLAWLIVDPSVEVQVQALLILGNLCSDACDPNSSTTKRVLLDRGGHRAIILAVQSDDPVVLVYACGCLQNLCHDDAWAHALVAHEVEKRLEELVTGEAAVRSPRIPPSAGHHAPSARASRARTVNCMSRVGWVCTLHG